VYGFGSEVNLFARFGWFADNSGKHVHPPRALRPSIRGLFDLHGNLFEWTHDWIEDYAAQATTDPLGSKGGSNRVLRGGSWDRDAADCRSGGRGTNAPFGRTYSFGFRLALSPSEVSPKKRKRAEPSGGGTKGAPAEQRRVVIAPVAGRRMLNGLTLQFRSSGPVSSLEPRSRNGRRDSYCLDHGMNPG
jgi:hypothetical protein